jgi:hypothetical protein
MNQTIYLLIKEMKNKSPFFMSSDIVTKIPWYISLVLLFIKGNIYIDPPEYGKSQKTITVIKHLFGKIYVTESKQISIIN